MESQFGASLLAKKRQTEFFKRVEFDFLMLEIKTFIFSLKLKFNFKNQLC